MSYEALTVRWRSDRVAAAFIVLMMLSTPLLDAQVVPATTTCGEDTGQAVYIRRVARDKKEVVLLGRGLSPDLLVFVDGAIVQSASPQSGELRFPIGAYPGEKELPANVQVQVESRDGSQSSNVCTFRYPGDFPLLLGGATGLTNREEEPAAMALAFIGLFGGSVQDPIPTLHADGRDMKPAGRFLRRVYIVAGRTKVAGTEGPGWTAGLAFRAGEIKLLYAVRFNSEDYPRHIFGVAGAFKISDLVK